MSEDKPQLPPVPDALLEHIKNFIKDQYQPVTDPAQATMRMTTMELMHNICRIYPNPPVTPNVLAQWMHEMGFRFWDAGNMRWEWLMKG